MKGTDWARPELSEFNYTDQKIDGDTVPSQEKTKHVRHRFPRPSKRGMKRLLHLPWKKPIFGRDGPRGSWYVRIPLWLQSTILIFFIGFLSLLVLTIVSAVKVWSYTENLMENRLSTLAGMTGIEIEQAFDSLERSVTATTSRISAINFLTAANNNETLIGYWDAFTREFGIEISLSDCLAMELYDAKLQPIFTYRKRTSSNRFAGQQNDLIPRELFPLAQPDLQENMLANLNDTEGGVLANATANQVHTSLKNVNLTYSVSQKITPESQLSIFGIDKASDGDDRRTKVLGYSTFVFKNQVTSAIFRERLFPQYIIEIVRLNDIVLGDTYSESMKSGSFSFLYPYINENGVLNPQQNWTLSSFPVLIDAIDLLLRPYNMSLFPSQRPQRTNSSLLPSEEPDERDAVDSLGSQGYESRSDMPALIGDGQSPAPGAASVVDYAARKREDRENGLFARASNNSSLFPHLNSTRSNSNSSSSTNSGQGDIPSQFNLSSSSNRSSLVKTDMAHMKTKAPFDNKSSIGYSYASVYDQKWLVFVQIPEKEAFNDARHLRNVIIGVGAGILGAVLLILLPLSRWQTKGFYIIYQNMKLRPILILDNTEERDPEEDRGSTTAVAGRSGRGGENGDGGGGAVKRIESQGESTNDLDDDSFSQDDKPQIQPLAGGDDDEEHKDVSAGQNSLTKHRTRDSNKGRVAVLPKKDGKRASSESTNARDAKDYSKHDTTTGSSCSQSPSRSDDQENLESINFESSSQVVEKRRYRFNTPKPLPPLNRWYSDEVDDLIREYNNMTEKLNAYYLHLEDQVRIRTREAQKARELREEANAAKSEFIAIISHELRTPLNGIMGLTAVNADEVDVTKIRSALRVIIESGHILMDLLNELLELSKSLVGVEPSVNEFTPVSLLEMLPTLFSPRTPVLTTQFALAAVPPTAGNILLRGDVDHICHICLNFMSNAMKFSEQNGNVSVIVQIRPLNDPLINLAPYGTSLEKANAVLEILVTDSGVGISSAQLAKIFDLFVQGEDPLRKNQKGVGLGMALSKQLAEGIGGYIAVFSAKGVGTTTVLHVPVEAVGLTAEEVLAFNGPPIEFKVRDVYSTVSLHTGEVRLLRDSWAPSGQVSARESLQNARDNQQTSQRKTRHTHQGSNGSKLLLNRAHPVSRLLRAQSTHQHNHSQYSNRSHGSQGSTPTTENASASSVRGTVSSLPTPSLPAVVGTHANHSASSLLLNIPSGMFDDDTENVRSSIISTGTEFFEVPQASLDRSSPTPGSSSAPKTSLSKYGATVQRRNSAMLKIVPPTLSLPRDSSASATSGGVKSPSYLPDSVPNTAGSDTTGMYSLAHEHSDTPDDDIDRDARILLVEDNQLNQQIMVKVLQSIGMKYIDTAGDGETVIQLVEQSIVDGFHYGIIFMDLSMPGMNGIEATQVIRGTLGYPYPIVALTGFSDIETRNACIAANIQDVLTKPVMKYDIIRVLETYSSSTAQRR